MVRLGVLLLAVAACFRASAAPPATGPTLHLDYGQGQALVNPAIQFMYFVPLLSPEQVTITTDPANRQTARVTSCHSHTNGLEILTTCEFEFAGQGWQKNVFGHDATIRSHAKILDSGKPLPHQLSAIDVDGPGLGCVEIHSALTNGQAQVNEVRLLFNNRGRSSPVTITLQDIIPSKGGYRYTNDTIARVNALIFRRATGRAKMEVLLDSVKRKDAANSVWQNFLGDLKGVAANFFLPPLFVAPEGQQAMLDFGQALAARQPDFTFPPATRLQVAANAQP